MPPEEVSKEDVVEVKFSAPEGGRIEKLTAKVNDKPIPGARSPHGESVKAPAGQWKLRWEIRGKARGNYHLLVTVNGQEVLSEDMSFDEWGVDNGFYP